MTKTPKFKVGDTIIRHTNSRICKVCEVIPLESLDEYNYQLRVIAAKKNQCWDVGDVFRI